MRSGKLVGMAAVLVAVGVLGRIGRADSVSPSDNPNDPNGLSIVLTLTGSPVAMSGFYLWTYSVDLTAGAELSYPSVNTATNEGVALFDIAGFKPGSSTFTSSYSFTKQEELVTGLISADPFLLYGGVDSPLAYNISLTFTGGSPIGSFSSSTPLHLGTLSFLSSISTESPEVFRVASQDDLSNVGGQGGEFSTTETVVPSANIPTSVPLPASLWGGLSLLGLVGGAGLRTVHGRGASRRSTGRI